jgi:uncharacterized CHY-type Zn-finger protein
MLNNDFVYCSLCFNSVTSDEYDDELGMCHNCIARLRVDFKASNDKKPMGKIKSLRQE